MANLTRDDLIDAWTRLGELAHAEGESVDIIAVGGDVDFRDALRILQALEAEPGTDCSSAAKVLQLVDPYFVPSQRMKASYALEELWELHDPPGADRSSDPGEQPA